MNPEFERFLKIATADSIITDNERAILLRKAETLGMDMDEAELIIESYSQIASETTKLSDSQEKIYDITDEELLIRSNKWVNLCNEKLYKGVVEKFPEISKKQNIEKYLKLGTDIFSGIAFFNPTGKALQITKYLLNGNKSIVLKNTEIQSIAEAYLLLLEKRGVDNSFLSDKHAELKLKMENKLKEVKQGGFRGFF